MANIVLLAETGSDLPQAVADKEGIYLVPMHVTFDKVTKDDGTFPADDIVNFYKETGILPKTSGSVPEDFTVIIDRIKSEQPDAEILYLAYSAVTTCSYQSCQIASEGMDFVKSVDTKHVSVGQAIVVLTMAKLLREHPEWTLEDAAKAAEEVKDKVRMCFVPDTLEFLRAGGRVSNAAALCGSLLKLHPRIEIQDGYLNATKKPRGSLVKIAPKLVRDYMAEQNLSKEKLWLIYAPGTAAEVMEAAENEALALGVKEVEWMRTGGVITCHGGPGAFGLVGIAE